MKNFLILMGYKRLNGTWDKREIRFDIVVVSLAVISGYILAEVFLVCVP